MALSDIRGAIKTVLDAINPTIGVVTAYEPLTTRKEHFDTFFKSGALAYLQGWTISRESSGETVRDQARVNERRHLMVIRGYRTIDNKGASEAGFQDDVERVCDALRVKENDQLAGQADVVGPPAVRIFEPRDFAGYLVHYVEIAYPVTEPKTF